MTPEEIVQHHLGAMGQDDLTAEIDGDQVTVYAGLRAAWVDRKLRRQLERRLSIDLHRPVTVQVAAGRLA